MGEAAQPKGKVLVVNKMHDCIISRLEGMGYQVDYLPEIKAEEVAAELRDAVGLIIRSKVHVDADLLQAAPRLRFVARAGAGVDNVDLDLLADRNIRLLNAPEGNRDALAEHALGMLLALFNKLNWADAQVRNGVWDREGNRGVELRGKKVAVVGYGYMGCSFVEKLRGFGCTALVYDKYKSGLTLQEHAREVDMETMFAEADVLSLHVPLTYETRFLVDEDFFGRFSKHIFVLNTSRGEVLSLKALVNAMKKGKVLGAALDVLENEKLSSLTQEQKDALKFLTDSKKTLFSPHVGGWTVESYRKISEVLADKVEALPDS